MDKVISSLEDILQQIKKMMASYVGENYRKRIERLTTAKA